MENKLIRSKYFLYLTEFFAGMSVMAVELGASRLMAPYFSSSQIVWTVIIGVIMIAMAIGNVWGGKLADKSATPDKLYRRLIIAAIWIALIPFVGRYLIAGISLLLALFVTKNFLVWAALAACLVIFAFPCVLLGTVTPSLTRFTVDNLDDTGKTVGRLNALNTIGGGALGFAKKQWAICDATLMKELCKIVYITRPTVFDNGDTDPLKENFTGYVDFGLGWGDARQIIFSNPA